MILELNNLITMIALSTERKKKKEKEKEMIDRPVGVYLWSEELFCLAAYVMRGDYVNRSKKMSLGNTTMHGDLTAYRYAGIGDRSVGLTISY